jgi:hypothetical protein
MLEALDSISSSKGGRKEEGREGRRKGGKKGEREGGKEEKKKRGKEAVHFKASLLLARPLLA